MAETNDFTLKIITPDRVFYEKPVKMVEFNTVEGEIGVLPGHIPMTVIIKPGVLTITEEDKLVVSRARRVQRFLSQPFYVAEQFTGYDGKYVPISETIRGFKEILEGKHDDIPESYFLNAGTIDEVRARVQA